MEFDSKAKDFLVEKGFDPVYGARPMHRAVERFLEDPLAEEILRGKLHDGLVTVTVEGDKKLSFTQNTAAAAEEETRSASKDCHYSRFPDRLVLEPGNTLDKG